MAVALTGAVSVPDDGTTENTEKKTKRWIGLKGIGRLFRIQRKVSCVIVHCTYQDEGYSILVK